MTCFCYYDFESPVGRLGIAGDGPFLTHIFPEYRRPLALSLEKETPLIQEAALQLRSFFAGDLRQFSLPLLPCGTPFQNLVWSVLLTIPYGETRSYQDIAAQIGLPKGARAVGRANGSNPIPFLIPCHRVVTTSGALGGYALGTELKQWLLALEGR